MNRPALALLLLLCGCQMHPTAQRGGKASSTLGGIRAPVLSPQTAASVTQPDNPAAPTVQTVKRTETTQEAAPLPSVRTTETPTPAGVVRVVEQFGTPTVLTHTVAEETGTTIGAAQKDTSRDIAAKLASFRGVQWAGIALLVLAAGMFHPVVRLAIGAGKEMQMATAAIGAALVFGPSIVVGHELLFAAGASVALAVAWLSFRLSYKAGALDAAKPSSPPVAGV